MGLDTTHGCWHGAYSAFGRFREAIATAAGYKVDYEAHPLRAYQGWWDDDHDYSDPLDVLIIHSDCDGYIFPKDAQRLIPRLTALLPKLSADPPVHGYPTEQARLAQFIAGLQSAVDEWQIVEFH